MNITLEEYNVLNDMAFFDDCPITQKLLSRGLLKNTDDNLGYSWICITSKGLAELNFFRKINLANQ